MHEADSMPKKHSFSQARIRRIEAVLRTLHNRGLKNQGATVKVLAGIHRRHVTTIRRYLKFLGDQNLVWKGQVGNSWIWHERRKPEGPGPQPPPDDRKRILDDHNNLVAEEDSPRIKYIEAFYSIGYSIEVATAKINEIKSLTSRERVHVIEHVRFKIRERGGH
jgi:hypothetical protein